MCFPLGLIRSRATRFYYLSSCCEEAEILRGIDGSRKSIIYYDFDFFKNRPMNRRRIWLNEYLSCIEWCNWRKKRYIHRKRVKGHKGQDWDKGNIGRCVRITRTLLITVKRTPTVSYNERHLFTVATCVHIGDYRVSLTHPSLWITRRIEIHSG